MPATEVELDNRDESVYRVVDVGHWKESIWVCHETCCRLSALIRLSSGGKSHFVILSSIDLSSRMKVGRVTRERSAPGRNWEMICERTACSSVHS